MVHAILFFVIAVLYASVGFGGGSGYIAILSFTNADPSQLRFIALCCNIVVVSGGTWLFIKNQLFHVKKMFPFVITSVPLAFLGGSIQLDTQAFYILLSISLLIAGVLMLRQPVSENMAKSNKLINGSIGGVIGFVSGLIGIGGGIFLAPLLHLIKWDKPKVISAAASFFILVNSVAGLVGQVSSNTIEIQWKYILPLLLSVFLGGQIGSRLNVNWLSQIRVKRMTAILVIFASIRMIYKVCI